MKKLFFLITFFIFYFLTFSYTAATCGCANCSGKICKDEIRVEKTAENKYEATVSDAKLFSDKPIRYDSSGKTFFVTINNKEIQLKATPKKAVEVAYITGMMNEFDQEGEYKKVGLVEKNGKVFYEVKGRKTGKIFGIWKVSYDTKAEIDGEGKLANFEKPWILKILKYFIK